LRVDADSVSNGLGVEIKHAFGAHRGECPVVMEYRQPAGSAIVKLGERWRVAPTDSLLDRLKELIGHEQVEVVYER